MNKDDKYFAVTTLTLILVYAAVMFFMFAGIGKIIYYIGKFLLGG